MPRARRIPTFMMGADPELALFKNGRFYNADNIEGLSISDRFGKDGCGAIVELRPTPAEEPSQLVENLRICLAEGLEKYPAIRRCELKAGSYYGGHPIGGHIHFGTRNVRRDSYPNIVSCLDATVAQITVPLEERAPALARRSSYGGLGDWREQRWGFEYRAPSSWMTSPKIALGVLSLAKVVVAEALLDADGSFLRQCHTLLSGAAGFTVTRIRRMAANLPTIRGALGECHLYPKYNKDIEFLYALVLDGRTWMTDRTLSEEWGLATSFPARGRVRLPSRGSLPNILAPQTLEGLLRGQVNIA